MTLEDTGDPANDDGADLDDDLGLDDDDADAGAPPAAEPPAAGAQDPPAPAGAPDATAVAAAALEAVKDSWAEVAKGSFPLADFAALGIAGLDAAARERFMGEAKASHDARVTEFKALGLVFDPEAAGAGTQEARDAQREAVLAAAWGQPVAGGGGSGPSQDEQVMQAVQESAAKGDVDGTIRHLLGGGKLAEFFVKGRR